MDSWILYLRTKMCTKVWERVLDLGQQLKTGQTDLEWQRWWLELCQCGITARRSSLSLRWAGTYSENMGKSPFKGHSLWGMLQREQQELPNKTTNELDQWSENRHRENCKRGEHQEITRSATGWWGHGPADPKHSPFFKGEQTLKVLFPHSITHWNGFHQIHHWFPWPSVSNSPFPISLPSLSPLKSKNSSSHICSHI